MPMASIAPSERFRRELSEVLSGVGGDADPVETTGERQSILRLKRWTKDRLCRNMSYE